MNREDIFVHKRPSEKAAALSELRDAVEAKVRAEIALERGEDARARNALLDATLQVDAKTQDALELCFACNRPRQTRDARDVRSRIVERADNLLVVDFRTDELRNVVP